MILISSALLFIDNGCLSWTLWLGLYSLGQGLGGGSFDGSYRSSPYLRRSVYLDLSCYRLCNLLVLLKPVWSAGSCPVSPVRQGLCRLDDWHRGVTFL